MFDKSRSVLEELFLKVEDFILATTFKFWYWLGVQLDVTIEVPQPKPWVITEYIKGDAGVDPKVHQAVKDELARTKEALGAHLQYVGMPQRVIVGGYATGPNRPNNNRKLTPSEVEEIREMKRAGTSQADIAYAFDVNPATVSRIVRGLYHRKLAAA